MHSLNDTVAALAQSFAAAILESIRSASLEELVGEVGGSRPVRRTTTSSAGYLASAGAAEPLDLRGPKAGKPGRLVRRTQEDVNETIQKIVTLLKKHDDGLRAEEIRSLLGLDAREMPRPLADALATKALKKTGHKRSTTYFLGGESDGSPAGAKGTKSVAKPPKKASLAPKKASLAPKKNAKTSGKASAKPSAKASTVSVKSAKITVPQKAGAKADAKKAATKAAKSEEKASASGK